MAVVADTYSKKEFNRLRMRITVACTSIVVFVLAIILIVVTLAEYNSKMRYLEEQVSTAVESLLDGADISQLEKQAKSSKATGTGSYYESYLASQGGGSAPSNDSYVPIAIFREDTENGTIVPLEASSASLDGTEIEIASKQLIGITDGFYRFNGSAQLAALKTLVNGNEIIAVTDASSLDQYLADFVKTFISLIAVIVLLSAGMFYNMSNWFIEPVREMWKKQQQFIADASHELKTPVSVIMANSDIITTGSTDEETVRRAEIIFEESDKMTRLIADMMYLLTDKAQSAGKEPFDLSRAIKKSTMVFEAKAWERKVLFDDEEVEDNICALCDPEGVSRVISILLDNACKYAEEGTCCTISLSAAKKTARMSVTNRGEEIPEEDLAALFERFFRTDSARTRTKETSYGLGLSMARDIIDANGGKISASSEDGKITFLVELPLADPPQSESEEENKEK